MTQKKNRPKTMIECCIEQEELFSVKSSYLIPIRYILFPIKIINVNVYEDVCHVCMFVTLSYKNFWTDLA